jgi:hypothetical protein
MSIAFDARVQVFAWQLEREQDFTSSTEASVYQSVFVSKPIKFN